MMFKEYYINEKNKAIVEFDVNRPIDEAFDLIRDLARYNSWVPDNSMVFIDTKITSADVKGIDTTFIDRLRFGGKSIGKVVSYDPPKRFSIEQITYFYFPLFSTFIDYELSYKDKKTLIRHTAIFKMFGLYKIMTKIHGNFLRKERSLFCEAAVRKIENNLSEERLESIEKPNNTI